MIAVTIPSCDEISHGQQRRKFEFLYKFNNFGTIFKEYTNDVTYFKDLDLYSTRLNGLHTDANSAESVKGWQRSDAIREMFLAAVEKNLEDVNVMKQKQAIYAENIRNEYEVVKMRERAMEFLEAVEAEIVSVGRE